MPPLDKKLFLGENEIGVEDCVKLEVRNFSSDAESCLKEYGWDGGAAAYIGLTLGADNRCVERGQLMLAGPLGDYREEGPKLWAGCKEGVTLVVKVRSAAVFSFANGTMASEITPQESLEHAFFATASGGTTSVILETEYERYGIGEFCMRAVAFIGKNSSVKEGVVVKCAVLVFPTSKDELTEKFTGAQEAAWPGLLAMEADCPLLIKARSPWGCPIWPLLLTSIDLEQQPHLPGGEELRLAIAGIMASSTLPETSRTAKSLLNKWRRLAASPEELVAKKGQLDWPKQQQRQDELGKYQRIIKQ
jgi:hypothetical protein